MKKLIILLLLSTFVNAGIQRISISDTTSNGYNVIQLIQNDSVSSRWVKTMLINQSEPHVIQDNINYTWYLEPSSKSILSNLKNPNLINYIWYHSWRIVLILILFTLVLAIWYKWKVGR